MKKPIPILLAVFLTLAFSQLAFAGVYGFKLGVNSASISNVDLDPEFEVSRKMGLIFGAFYTLSLNDQIAIQPEFYYSQKGIKVSGTLEGTKISGKDSLNYLDIPVLMKMRIPAQGKLTPSIFAAPCVSILLDAKEMAEWNGESQEQDIKEDLNSLDFGMSLGATLEFETRHGILIIDLRYTLGLTKILKFPDDPNSKNSSLTLMTGFAFH